MKTWRGCKNALRMLRRYRRMMVLNHSLLQRPQSYGQYLSNIVVTDATLYRHWLGFTLPVSAA